MIYSKEATLLEMEPNHHLNLSDVFLTAIAEGGPWASDCVWDKGGGGREEGPLAEPEPVTGPWVYTEAVYLFLIQTLNHLGLPGNNVLPLIQCLTREHTVPNKGAYGAEQGICKILWEYYWHSVNEGVITKTDVETLLQGVELLFEMKLNQNKCLWYLMSTGCEQDGS